MSRPLAKHYATLLYDSSNRSLLAPVMSRDKRAGFRLAKAVARRMGRSGFIVELRAESRVGAIIERVQLAYEGRRVRWRQAFET